MENLAMNRPATATMKCLLGWSCLVAPLLATSMARGDGSIAFNGTSSPSGGTSNLENTTANVLSGSNIMTICAWVYRAGAGEGNAGTLLTLDHVGGSGSSVKIQNSSS
jgi:hypothetical protein